MSSSLPQWPPPISAVNIGNNVIVNGEKQGVLKYVGPIFGKDGIYCGIELYEPAGFNDGTFRGQRPLSQNHEFFSPIIYAVKYVNKIYRPVFSWLQ